MDAALLLDKLNALGISVTIAGEKLQLQPGSKVPPEMVEELHYQKAGLIDAVRARELQEIARRVMEEGYVLLWSTVLEDSVAFYKNETDRDRIPAGFVPYSDSELQGHRGA
jgi:hypothetical protein